MPQLWAQPGNCFTCLRMKDDNPFPVNLVSGPITSKATEIISANGRATENRWASKIWSTNVQPGEKRGGHRRRRIIHTTIFRPFFARIWDDRFQGSCFFFIQSDFRMKSKKSRKCAAGDDRSAQIIFEFYGWSNPRQPKTKFLELSRDKRRIGFVWDSG